MKRVMAVFMLCGSVAALALAEEVRMDKARFLDKCRGAWAGQMIGVCYGAPYEFRSNGAPITEELAAWQPEAVKGAIGQDDCYVEMTFLEAIEDYGLDVTYEQAGEAFGQSEYPLWHANRAGRENIRAGIMPPLSGHPLYNRHADDIDFQIEADLFGILCPGLPQESNRLCEVFGHLMNYGDGVYGGMFVSGMYAAAYFEDNDVRAVLEAGLACIPAASTYHQCIRDTIAWHDEHPDEWLAAWQAIEDKWQDDVDCAPGNPFNIDAKLNGAYIAMGLLYGEGDMLKTAEIATRCGQDADCNPSNAAGVIGCMKGYAALGEALTGGIAAIEDKEFIYTDYSFKKLIEACERTTAKIVARTGGAVDESGYAIARQEPLPPITLEQWVDEPRILSQPILAHEARAWDSAWRVMACGIDMEPGLRPEEFGRPSVLVIHPVSETEPGAIEATLDFPQDAKRLVVDVASDREGDFVLRVLIDGAAVSEELVDTKGAWKSVAVDVTPFAGRKATVRLLNCANGWSWEAAYFDAVRIE
ncbi:MAG TPA: ADP-ribosylglycohydrolase family protein [Candidatus Hydrogenedentes bacterium]|nr:ADP-ribosylglycohydrolase family protein [Candidatus Hydrogenedentota bacterium]HPG67617.1 ADP-ribosylglycohydrolase family protein [Candidatus Hydrogenedentota bacterium]